jgi:multidrug efflux system outer membrane protein
MRSGANSANVTNALNSATGPVSLFQDGFDASWELDLFGRVRRSVESANAQTESEIENRNDALSRLRRRWRRPIRNCAARNY